MFYLLIGVIAGAVLTYLWTDVTIWEERVRGSYVPTPPRPYRWPVWTLRWSAIALIVVLLIIVLAEFRGSGLGMFSATKAIVVPTLVGMVLGAWIYAALAPVVRGEASATWIPMLIALLFVAAILSEDRYGWFTRLQKITIAGGGIEFAALAPSGTTPADRSRLGTFESTGATRVSFALLYMETLPGMIKRDRGYGSETGLAGADEDYRDDLDFATEVIGPLGKRLRDIHSVRGYNDIGFVTDRDLVNDFRAFTHGYLKHRKMDGNADPVRMLATRIKKIWSDVCVTDHQLRAAGFFKPPAAGAKPDPTCEEERDKAGAFLDRSLGSTRPAIALNQQLPYGVLLSSVLLYAAGELDSAVRDIDRWIAFNGPIDADSFRQIGLYRARYYAAQLLTRDNPEADRIHLALEKYKDVIEQADSLLSNTFPANVKSWRGQRKQLDESDPDSRWSTVECAQDLSRNFKIFMAAYLSAKNNLAYHLSQNLELARLEQRDSLMLRLAEEITKVNMSCLRKDASVDEDDNARSSRASFLDTAATVQLELALREERRDERRTHLCKAQKYLGEAIAAYAPVIQRMRGPDSKPAGMPPTPWEDQEAWAAKRERMAATEMTVILQRRLQRVQGTLAFGGLSC